MRVVAFVEASYVEAHNSANRNLCIQSRLHYGSRALDALRDEADSILLTEAFTDRSKHHRLIGPSTQRCLKSLHAWDKSQIAHT